MQSTTEEGLDFSFNNSKYKQRTVNYKKPINGQLQSERNIFQKQCTTQLQKTSSKIYSEKQKLYYRPIRRLNFSCTQEQIKSSEVYKELMKKFNQIKQQQILQKQRLTKSIKQKSETIKKARIQQERLHHQKQKYIAAVKELKQKLYYLQQKNQQLRANLYQTDNHINPEYFRNILLSLRYQNQLLQYQINPDNMTYEELLLLQQKIGNVSKGLTQQKIKAIPKYQYLEQKQDEICPICYYEIKRGEIITKLSCQHGFHFDCIQGWLQKQKICPMCKQEIEID